LFLVGESSEDQEKQSMNRERHDLTIVRNILSGNPLQALFLAAVAISIFGCQAPKDTQAVTPKRIGGPFEHAEYFYYGMPSNLDSTNTSPGWSQVGQKLIVSGTVYKRDGKTPAPGIILYYYHTDVNGLYSAGPGLDERARRHGYIRGWVKSDAVGNYTIRTVRPASYPNEKIPSHIHVAVKEPELNEYYVDDLVFEDDPLLTPELQREMENRGGSGILRPRTSGDLQIAGHDFILGLNIPDYPEDGGANAKRGLQLGE
jgi:protocatechuate 3,4-dioxygenase beta subunit